MLASYKHTSLLPKIINVTKRSFIKPDPRAWKLWLKLWSNDNGQHDNAFYTCKYKSSIVSYPVLYYTKLACTVHVRSSLAVHNFTSLYRIGPRANFQQIMFEFGWKISEISQHQKHAYSRGHILDALFSSQLTNRPKKLVCFSLARLFSLVWCNTLAYWAHSLVMMERIFNE
jgi:hypothetical protein